MLQRKQLIEDFFDRYSANFNAALDKQSPDVETSAAFFAGSFIGSGPAGVNCGKNDDAFRKSMQQGYAFHKSIGITSMVITAKEIKMLDELHVLSKIYWRSAFTRNNRSTGKIDFSVTYFLRDENNTPKIFAYITGDEQKALKENGLL